MKACQCNCESASMAFASFFIALEHTFSDCPTVLKIVWGLHRFDSDGWDRILSGLWLSQTVQLSNGIYV